MSTVITNLKTFFPENRGKWIKYTKTSLPVIFAAMVFSLNSFVDNFMAVDISGGIQSLSYANSWTSLVNGIVVSTSTIGSVLFGQYLGTEDRVRIREVVRARMTIALAISLLFAIPAIIVPNFMISLISGFDKNIPQNISSQAIRYMWLISITWVMSAWGYTSACILREAGHGGASLVSSCLSLLTNILFNSIFVFALNKGIEFLAYSTIISQVISIGFNVSYMWFKDKKIIINPLKLFAVSSIVWKQFLRRSTSFLLLSAGSIAVSIRFIFWNVGYDTGSVGGNELYYLSAATILGISGMFFNIFWTTFESINANIAIFVGRELGQNNIKQAKINAKELQGYQLVVAFIMASALFSLSFLVQYFSFLTKGYEIELTKTLEDLNKFTPDQIKEIVSNGKIAFLENLKWTLWPLAWNIPIWIWYITKSRLIGSGGMTNIVSIVDASFGALQTGWIILINFAIVSKAKIDFPWAYALFFVSDLFKIVVFEILYVKLEWARNVAHEGEIAKSIK